MLSSAGKSEGVAHLVRAYFAAFERKDRPAVEALVGEPFTFTSPWDDQLDRRSYFAQCWPVSETIRQIRIDKLFEQGEEAFVRYRLETTGGDRFNNTEHFTFAGHKIRRIEVFFGREEGKAAGRSSAEAAAVRSVIDAFTDAVRRKDVESLMVQCAPDIATFDLVPPLVHEGAAAIRSLWERTLEPFEAPLEYDIHQLDLVVGSEVAYSRSLNRFGGKRRDGGHQASWLCSTLGLRKTHGRWRIVHQHVSVPFDMQTGQALLDLVPQRRRN